jgi:hypothetical protein
LNYAFNGHSSQSWANFPKLSCRSGRVRALKKQELACSHPRQRAFYKFLNFFTPKFFPPFCVGVFAPALRLKGMTTTQKTMFCFFG